MALDLTRFESIIAPICRAYGIELVDVRFAREPGGAVLRVLIDRERPEGTPLSEGGVTLDDCKNVSRDLSTALDVEDVVSGKYRLEVSSPGIERPLVKEQDFVRFAGHEAKVVTKFPVGDGNRKVFQGLLRGVDAGKVLIGLDEVETAAIPMIDIAKANLVHRWEKPGKPSKPSSKSNHKSKH